MSTDGVKTSKSHGPESSVGEISITVTDSVTMHDQGAVKTSVTSAGAVNPVTSVKPVRSEPPKVAPPLPKPLPPLAKSPRGRLMAKATAPAAEARKENFLQRSRRFMAIKPNPQQKGGRRCCAVCNIL